MLPPYTSDEVAEAVLGRLRALGCPVARLTVAAHDLSREWRVTAELEDGREVVASYPFSAPEGIHVPAEIAAWFAERVPQSE